MRVEAASQTDHSENCLNCTSATGHESPMCEDESGRSEQVRRGRWLEYFTVGYNSIEGLLAVGSGLIAGSIALVGFGFDSAIEVLSGSILIWRLHTDADATRRDAREKRALKLVGWSFLVLAAWITWDGVISLWNREAPDESLVGIAVAAVSLVVMPLLVRAKREVAAAISSRALDADATQTALCTWLSAILLAGLILNATLGWWWADPVAALVMVPIIAFEGVEALRGEECAC